MTNESPPIDEIGNEIVEIVDWQTLGIPPRHKVHPIFKKLDRGMKLASSPGVELLLSVTTLLCIYDRLDRAIRVAEALTPIRRGMGVQFSYVSSSMSVAACFADRSNDPRAEALRQATLFPGGEPQTRLPNVVDGSRLNNLFDQSKYDHATYVGWATSDIQMLADMWVFGSPKFKWNKRRIGKEIDRNVAGILALPNWGPWDAE